MKNNVRTRMLLAVSLIAIPLLCGCPPPNRPTAPFNATGRFAGEWTGEIVVEDESAGENR